MLEYENQSTLTLSYDEIVYIVSFIKNFENEDLPETLRDEILPKLCDFLYKLQTIYSDDDLLINGQRLCLAAGDDDYFCHTTEIEV